MLKTSGFGFLIIWKRKRWHFKINFSVISLLFFFVLCNSVIYDISLNGEHKLNFFASILKYIFCKLYSIVGGTKNVINTNIFYQNKNIKLTVILLTIHFILFVQSEDGKKKISWLLMQHIQQVAAQHVPVYFMSYISRINVNKNI